MIQNNKKNLIEFTKLCQSILYENTVKEKLLNNNADFFVDNFLNNSLKHISMTSLDDTTNEVYFELYKARTQLWDIIFISEYIQNQLGESKLEELNNLTKYNINFLLNKLSPKTNLEYKKIERALKVILLLNESISKKYQINNNNLETKLLKQTCIIPLEYLGEFSRGISVTKKDRNYIEIVDKIVFPLFENLSLDYKELPNFLYNTPIDRINFLLEILNNKENKLLQLPSPLFSSIVPVSYIKKILKLINNNPKVLKEIPNIVFLEKTNIEYLKELLSLIDNDYSKLNNLPNEIFAKNMSLEKIKRILKYTKKHNIDELANLSSEIFNCSEKRLNFFVTKAKLDLTRLKNINYLAYSGKTTEERLLLLINLVNENFQELININPLFYITNNKRVRHILQLINNDINKMSLVPNIWFNENTKEERINKLYELSNKDLNKLNKLPDIAYNSKITEERLNYLINISSNKINKLKEIPSILYSPNIKESKIEEILKLCNDDIEELKYIPNLIYLNKVKITQYRDILLVLTDKEEITLNDYKLVFPFLNINIKEQKFIYQRLLFLMKHFNYEDISLLPIEVFQKYTTNVRISFILDIINHDISKLPLVPKEVYLKHLKATRIISLYNLVDKDFNNLANLPKEIYTFPLESLSCLYNLKHKIKPLLGLGDSKIIITILYMLVVFSQYDEDTIVPNQLFSKFEITSSEDINKVESDNIKNALYNLNNTIDLLPKTLIYNSKKDFKNKLIKDVKKLNETLFELDKSIIKHNKMIIKHIINSITELRFHVTDQNLILEDYSLSEDMYRNRIFKIEGSINDFYELAKSLIETKRTISNQEHANEIYNKLNTNTQKIYGKRFISTLLNVSNEYKTRSNEILSVQKKLIDSGIKEMIFYIEDDEVNIGYVIIKRMYYTNINDIETEITKRIKKLK